MEKYINFWVIFFCMFFMIFFKITFIIHSDYMQNNKSSIIISLPSVPFMYIPESVLWNVWIGNYSCFFFLLLNSQLCKVYVVIYVGFPPLFTSLISLSSFLFILAFLPVKLESLCNQNCMNFLNCSLQHTNIMNEKLWPDNFMFLFFKTPHCDCRFFQYLVLPLINQSKINIFIKCIKIILHSSRDKRDFQSK